MQFWVFINFISPKNCLNFSKCLKHKRWEHYQWSCYTRKKIVKCLVLDSISFSTHWNYVTHEYISVLHKTMDRFNARFYDTILFHMSGSELLVLLFRILSCCADISLGREHTNISPTYHNALVRYYISRRFDIIKP